MKVGLLVEGGSMAPGPALAQKLGPMGINMSEVISKVNDATSGFKGMKVPVELEIDAATKQVEVIVRSPPVSELLKKELGLEKGSGEHKKLKVGNIAIEQVIKVAKTKLPDALERSLKAMVKTVVGSCMSLGILIDNKNPVDVESEIEQGKYDKEINEEKIEVSAEKKAKLDKFFKTLTAKQEAAIAEEEAAAAEAEKAKEAAAEGGEAKEGEEKPAEAPAEGEAQPEEKPAEEAK